MKLATVILFAAMSSFAGSGLIGPLSAPPISSNAIVSALGYIPGNSTNYINNNNGFGTNTTFNNITNNGILTNFGEIQIPSVRTALGNSIVNISFKNTTGGGNGVDGAIHSQNDHGGSIDTPELAILATFDAAFVLGYNGFGQLGATPSSSGITWGSLNTFFLQRNLTANSTTTFGDSAALAFECTYWDGSAIKYRAFGFIHEDLDNNGNTILRIYPRFIGQTNGTFANPGSKISNDGQNISQGGFGTNTFYYNNISSSNLTTAIGGFSSGKSIATASTAITFPNTTVNWTNTQVFNIVLYIDNTGVIGSVTKKNGQQIYSALVGDVLLMLKPGDYFSETYTSGTPSGRWEPQ